MGELLYQDQTVAEVILKCGSYRIPAHKIILSTRSPVFEAMFLYPMKEAVENQVVIEGIEATLLQFMLEYMYTGRTEGLTPLIAPELLFAANKFQIEGLESACSKYLMQAGCMSVKNVASILLIGDFISPDMKNFAIDYLCNKCTDFSALEKSKDWIDLKSKKPALALEIFSAIVKSQEQKLKMRV